MQLETQISIHAPVRGATLLQKGGCLNMAISIHAPVRGATVKELCEIVWGEFQSTLPRGERRVFLCHVTDNRSISIHAPARGATKQAAAPFRNCSYFNPRSREWSDRHHRKGRPNRTISIHAPASGETFFPAPALKCSAISIHAPASGATPPHYTSSEALRISIHAPASGATHNYPARGLSGLFQSTLPRVERLRKSQANTARTDFNPRSREWSDRYVF